MLSELSLRTRGFSPWRRGFTRLISREFKFLITNVMLSPDAPDNLNLRVVSSRLPDSRMSRSGGCKTDNYRDKVTIRRMP